MVDDTHPGLPFSVIITAHNEGEELSRTLASVREGTDAPHEILLVDDGSTDGSCDSQESDGIRLIRHSSRVGIAASRDEAALLANGNALAFLDGHQRISRHCLEHCAELACTRGAIVTPDIQSLENDDTMHGAYFVCRRNAPPLGAEWKMRPPPTAVSLISSLRAPGYSIPREIYPRVRWSPLLSGWGGSEASLSLKAFFAGIDILHLCGPVTRHRFKKTFHYPVDWPEIWRNHALIVRTCFDERTWRRYWLPEIFAAHLSPETLRELESESVRGEHEEFQRLKVRSDEEFWTRLLLRHLPAALR